MHSIRLATAADVLALHALIERAYRGATARRGWTHEADLLAGPRTDAAALAEIVAAPDRAMLVALDDQRIVACVEVSDRPGFGYLGQLAVDPERQASGIGRAMIAAAEEHAAARGAAAMEMTVIDRRDELIAYYRRRGYALTGEVRPFPYEQPISGPPLTLLVMARPL